jgi:hypothetical protein
MYYSIFKCNELKETYANENGIVYDYVIRVRFDFLPKQPIYCMSIDPNFIYYVAMSQPDDLISDWLNMGSNAIMNIYESLYLNMEYLNTLQLIKRDSRELRKLIVEDNNGVNYFSKQILLFNILLVANQFNSIFRVLAYSNIFYENKNKKFDIETFMLAYLFMGFLNYYGYCSIGNKIFFNYEILEKNILYYYLYY